MYDSGTPLWASCMTFSQVDCGVGVNFERNIVHCNIERLIEPFEPDNPIPIAGAEKGLRQESLTRARTTAEFLFC